jgi:hypothetical protein
LVNPEPSQTAATVTGSKIGTASVPPIIHTAAATTPPTSKPAETMPDSSAGDSSCLNNESGNLVNNNESSFTNSGTTKITGNGGSAGVGTESAVDMSTLSGWLKDAAMYLQAVLAEQAWQDLIQSWLMFEQHCRTEGVSHFEVLMDQSGTNVAIETTN